MKVAVSLLIVLGACLNLGQAWFVRPQHTRQTSWWGRPLQTCAATLKSNQCAHLYEHTNCKGKAMTADAGSSRSRQPRGWNDLLSSMVVKKGCKLTIYEHTYYQGKSRTFTSKTTNLKNIGWNDLMSSYKCSCVKPCPATVRGVCARMYEHSSCGGKSFDVCAGKKSNAESSWNDKVSSVVVGEGCRLTVYEHHKYGGNHVNFGPGRGAMTSWWNDRMSSYMCTCS